MRITFVLADSFGCGYFRCVVPGKALRERGHTVHFMNDWRDPKGVQCDILVVQRQSTKNALAAIGEAHSRGIKVVHEFDDSFHSLSPSNPNHKVYRTGSDDTKIMEQVCRVSDALIVSTPRLQGDYRKYNSNIHVCYNAISDEDVMRFGYDYDDNSSNFKRIGQIRIGWAGSDTHRADFALVVKPLVKIFDEFPQARVVFVGADMRPSLPLHYRHCDRVEFAGMTAKDGIKDISEVEKGNLATHRYYDMISKADFDIAIAPIESTTFNASKSYLKEMEYGLLGIPSVASNFGPYRQYAQEAPTQVCLLADDEREWYRHMKSLIENISLRESLLDANLSYVKGKHLISDRVMQWERVFESILGEGK